MMSAVTVSDFMIRKRPLNLLHSEMHDFPVRRGGNTGKITGREHIKTGIPGDLCKMAENIGRWVFKKRKRSLLL